MVKSLPLEVLFTWTVRSIYSAETQLVRTLPKIARRITHEGLLEYFDDQVELSERHLARLELISRRHDLPLTEKGSEGMRGIIEEVHDLLAEEDDSIVTHLALLDLMQKAGHYRLAICAAALSQADAMGWSHAVASIKAILAEEENASSELTAWTYEVLATVDSPRGGKTCFTTNAGRRG